MITFAYQKIKKGDFNMRTFRFNTPFFNCIKIEYGKHNCFDYSISLWLHQHHPKKNLIFFTNYNDYNRVIRKLLRMCEHKKYIDTRGLSGIYWQKLCADLRDYFDNLPRDREGIYYKNN